MRLEQRKAAFLIVLMGLALEAAVTPGPAAAEKIKRLEEHAGVQIFRGLDGDAEFQEPWLSRQPRPSPEQRKKEEAREEQREPPEVRPKEPQAPTGSVVCNVADRPWRAGVSQISSSTVPGVRTTRTSSFIGPDDRTVDSRGSTAPAGRTSRASGSMAFEIGFAEFPL